MLLSRFLLSARLAVRNLFRQKGRTGMALSAIGFGVVGLILSGGFVQDIFFQLGEALIHSQSGHIQIARAGYFAKGTRSPEKYVIEDPTGLLETVSAVPGVKDAMGRVSFSGLLGNGRTDLPIAGEGIEPDKETALGTYLTVPEGRHLAQTDTYGIMVGEGVAKRLNLHPGDPVTLQVVTPEGAMNLLDFQVTGIFQSFSKDYDARGVRIHLAAAQELLNSPGINVVVISLEETRLTASVARALAQKLGGLKMDLLTWEEINDFYAKTVDLYERQFGVLRLIVLVMVLLSVLNTVNMSILERAGEFGTMRALGNRDRHVLFYVLIEGAVLGLVGSVIGVLVGTALGWLISAVGIPMPPPPNSNIGYVARIRLGPGVIWGAFVVGWLATLLASIPPAFRVTRISVVEALRRVT